MFGYFWLALAIISSSIGLSACQQQPQEPVSLQSADPTRFEEGLPPHEQGLLRIFTQQLIDYERQQDFIGLYQQATTSAFRRSLPQKQFLAMTACLDRHLGKFMGHNNSTIKPVTDTPPEADYQEAVISYVIKREMGEVLVKAHIIQSGLLIKLSGITWQVDHREFQDCVKEALHLEKKTEMDTAEASSDTKSAEKAKHG